MYRIRRNPLLTNIEIGDIAYDTMDVLKLIGAPAIFQAQPTILSVSEYRTQIPCNLHKIISVSRFNNNFFSPLVKDTSNRATNHGCLAKVGVNSVNVDTYEVKRGFIYFDFEEGDIELNFSAIAVDEDGYPMIPDNVSVIKAIEAAIKVSHYTVKFDMGDISERVLNKAEQEYAWYIGQAQTSLIMPDVDEMESIKNSLIRLTHNLNEHNTGFAFQAANSVSVGSAASSGNSAQSVPEIDLSIYAPFDAGVVELSPMVITAELAGLYDALQVDSGSIDGTVNINGVDTPVPFTLAVGDSVIFKRTNGTAVGWLNISFNG